MNSYAVLQGPPVVFRVVATVRQATPTLARAPAKAVKDFEDYGIFMSVRQSLRGVYV